MADNVTITPGAGASIAADEVVDATLGTVKAQYVKIMDGTLDSSNKGYIGSNGAFSVMLATDAISSAGALLTPKRAFANLAVSQTNTSVIGLVAGKRIRVLQIFFAPGATATNITFTTLTTASAISPQFQNDSYGGAVLPFSPMGWFETLTGEGLGATTGAGSTTAVLIGYVEV